MPANLANLMVRGGHDSYVFSLVATALADQVVLVDIGKRPQLLQLILGEHARRYRPHQTSDPRQTVAVVISEADTSSALTHVRDIRPKFPRDYGNPSPC